MDRSDVTGSLLTELVAREIKDHKAFVLIFIIHLLEFLVLGSKTTFGGSVDDKEDLTLVLRQGYLLSVHVFDLEVIDALSAHCGGEGKCGDGRC